MSWLVAGIVVGSLAFSMIVVRVFIMPLMDLPTDPSDIQRNDET